MKIAVATDNNKVTQHFGHCENYNIYTVAENKIIQETTVLNPGHKPGFLPKFLADLDVTVIISGGIGAKAVEIFNAQGIEVVIGPQGDSKTAAYHFLEGKLKSNKAPCADNDHENKCQD